MHMLVYLAIAIFIVLAMWHAHVLPNQVSSMLDNYLPEAMVKHIKYFGCDNCPNKCDDPARGRSIKCEDFQTEAQCGFVPSACEFFEDKCRPRKLTAEEAQKA